MEDASSHRIEVRLVRVSLVHPCRQPYGSEGDCCFPHVKEILGLSNNTWSWLFLIRTRNEITLTWNIKFIRVESDFIVF